LSAPTETESRSELVERDRDDVGHECLSLNDTVIGPAAAGQSGGYGVSIAKLTKTLHGEGCGLPSRTEGHEFMAVFVDGGTND
jgi:hypothetical protein